MKMESTIPKKNKRKFKQTKQLVRLALNDSWTQNEIRVACRTQQSVVSAWSKGTKHATEEQLKPLLEQYGNKLRRNSFRVYWSIDPKTQQKTFSKVEGKVVLNQVFACKQLSSNYRYKKIPTQKLVIHHQSANKFRIVFQTRLKTVRGFDLESTTDDSVWDSTITEQTDLEELLKLIDTYSEENLKNQPDEALTLPFIARQALLNHGFDIEGVVEYPAVW
jgi:hypothetical protein